MSRSSSTMSTFGNLATMVVAPGPPFLVSRIVSVAGQGRVQVSRNTGSPPALPTKSDIRSVMSEETYSDFTTQLEFVHNSVHGWVGGTMSIIMTAPSDPIFW